MPLGEGRSQTEWESVMLHSCSKKMLGLLFINARVTAETREVPAALRPAAVESWIVLKAAMELETRVREERLRNWFM